MRILILNWRDPKHPRAGGAEVFTFEVARRLVAGGDQVEWFSAAFPGSAPQEELEGIRIVRRGRQWSVHWRAFTRYRNSHSQRFDVVIDEVNTMPFFTPLWCRVPRWMLIFQLAREVWWYEGPFPLNALGFVAEPQYLKCYRHTPVLTISKSTESDLRRLGFNGPMTVLPIATEPVAQPLPVKQSLPTFLYVGRLVPSKRIDHLLRALAAFREQAGAGQLWLVGEGEPAYVERLRREAAGLRVADHTSFLGRLSVRQKQERMAAAHLVLMASVREGWGLSITEAAACGTPSVVYDSPGLRDAVTDGQTGLIVAGSPSGMAEGMLRLWRDPSLYQRMAAAGKQSVMPLSFDATAARLRETIGHPGVRV